MNSFFGEHSNFYAPAFARYIFFFDYSIII
jgi:hypothetical protein